MASSRPANRLPPALELIESGLRLLRRVPSWALAVEWIATVPFAVGLAWFVADMTHHPSAAGHVASSALVLALLVGFCGVGQAIFAVELYRTQRGALSSPWTRSRLGRLALPQVALQSLSVITVPTALLLVAPFPFVFAWHQSVAVLAESADGRVRATALRAWHSSRRSWGNHLELTGLLLLCAAFLALNVAVAFLALPMLLRVLLAVETHVALSPVLALNTTFVSVVVAITWILLDPVIKAAYAVRHFHADALVTGEDLLPAFRPRAAASASASASLLPLLLGTALFLSSTPRASAADPDPARAWSRASGVVDTRELDQALETVLARPEFAWRLPPGPRGPELTEESARLTRLRESLVQFFRRVRDLLGRLLDWIESQLRSSTPASTGTPAWLEWLQSPQAVAALAAAVLAAGVFWLWWSRWRIRSPAPRVAAVAVAASPDLNADEVLASDLPAENWRSLADDLVRRGELRLAVRALYLATLADLGSRSLLLVARCKSNADYLGELRRRPRFPAPAIEAFSRLLTAFERVWYGSHPATRDLYELVAEDARRTRA